MRDGENASRDFPAITEPETGGFLVTVSGEIDLSREDDLSLAFATEGRVFVDMSQVAFIDSSGSRCLVVAKKQSASLELVSKGVVNRLLELAIQHLALVRHFSAAVELHLRVGLADMHLEARAGRSSRSRSWDMHTV